MPAAWDKVECSVCLEASPTCVLYYSYSTTVGSALTEFLKIEFSCDLSTEPHRLKPYINAW